ncbi:uncharacterized protein [Clytia hemisphaerica]|uniref:uncharacterized protein n=1 Tax=Clytia hemisphaerica TaxID=252671 RepID=UPI0034D5BE32|eukprot:TCONS_00065902-protein
MLVDKMILFLATFLLILATSEGMRSHPPADGTFLPEILNQKEVSQLKLMAPENFNHSSEYLETQSKLRLSFQNIIEYFIRENIDSMRLLENGQRKMKLIKEINVLTLEFSALIDRYFGDGLPLWQREVLRDQMDKTSDHILSLYQSLQNHYDDSYHTLIEQTQPKRTDGVLIQGVYITDPAFIKLRLEVEELRRKDLPVAQDVLDELHSMVTELVDREKSSLENLKFDYVFQWNRIIEERAKSKTSDADVFRNEFVFRFKQLERTELAVLFSVKKSALLAQIDELLVIGEKHKQNVIDIQKDLSDKKIIIIGQSAKSVVSLFQQIYDSKIKNPIFETKLRNAVDKITYSLKKESKKSKIKSKHMSKWNKYFEHTMNGRYEAARKAEKRSLKLLRKLLEAKHIQNKNARNKKRKMASPPSTRKSGSNQHVKSKAIGNSKSGNPKFSTKTDTESKSFTGMLAKLYDEALELSWTAFTNTLDLIPDSEFANEVIIATFSTIKTVSRATAKAFDDTVEMAANGLHSTNEYALKVYHAAMENAQTFYGHGVNALSVTADKGVSGFWWACQQMDETLDTLDSIHDILHELTKQTVYSGLENANEFLQILSTGTQRILDGVYDYFSLQ